jgi:ribonuclease HI
MNNLIVYTDGGARGNPGPAGIGVYITTPEGEKVFAEGKYIGVSTNNEAEYTAFQTSLDWLLQFSQEHPLSQVIWKLDSMLVVEQLNRKWKIKEPRMQVFATQIWQKLQSLPCPYKITHVRRAENAQADFLVNEALDLHQTGGGE